MENTQHEFTVVLRGPSALIFPETAKPGLLINSFPSPIGPVSIGFATRYIKHSNDIVTPGQLWIEVRGNAPNLEDCIGPFANAALSILPVLTLSGNASVEMADVELAFDCTHGISDRDYFQCHVPPEGKTIREARLVNNAATVALLEATFRNAESERLRRAAAQYQLALSNWRMGHDGLAAAHLWMALEALTKAKIRSECSQRNLGSPTELAKALNIELKELDATIRRRFLLCGDDECYISAKTASDGFEHGFLGYEEINKHAIAVRERLAIYVRKAIFDLLDLDIETKTLLLGDPFEKPMGNWPLVQYLRGKLIGANDQLAKGDNAYPFINWKTSIKNSASLPNGTRELQQEITFTPELAEGIKFQPIRWEIWRPH